MARQSVYKLNKRIKELEELHAFQIEQNDQLSQVCNDLKEKLKKKENLVDELIATKHNMENRIVAAISDIAEQDGYIRALLQQLYPDRRIEKRDRREHCDERYAHVDMCNLESRINPPIRNKRWWES